MPTARAKSKTSRTAAKPKASKVRKAPKAPPKAAKPAKAAKPEKAERVERIEKAEKPVRLDRAPAVDAKVSSQPEPFRLVAIERADPPSGAAGKNWYRYTIRQGANAINGYLQGTAAGVKNSAEQIVGQLNERRAGRWGYRTTRAAAPAQTG